MRTLSHTPSRLEAEDDDVYCFPVLCSFPLHWRVFAFDRVINDQSESSSHQIGTNHHKKREHLPKSKLHVLVLKISLLVPIQSTTLQKLQMALQNLIASRPDTDNAFQFSANSNSVASQATNGKLSTVTTSLQSSNPSPHSLSTMVIPSFVSGEHKVTHHYNDHANDPDGDYDVHQIVAKNGGQGAEQSFPMKLHYMLNDIEEDSLSHIVSWMPHGRCFVVHNQKLFVEKILGCWFRQSKIASFQRQLNIYGFQRLTTGPDKNGYYHELFLRGKPGLAARIQRQKLKGTKTRRAASPESEPNFYTMQPMPASRNASFPKPAIAPFTTTTGGNLPSTLPKSVCGGGSNALTLQKIVPSLFSPASFETTVHLVPQQQGQPRQHGLMVTSTCSLTLKPDDLGAPASSAFSLTQFPVTRTTTTYSYNHPQVCVPSTSPRANGHLWTALGASTSAMARPMAFGNGVGATSAPTPSPLWLTRP